MSKTLSRKIIVRLAYATESARSYCVYYSQVAIPWIVIVSLIKFSNWMVWTQIFFFTSFDDGLLTFDWSV